MQNYQCRGKSYRDIQTCGENHKLNPIIVLS